MRYMLHFSIGSDYSSLSYRGAGSTGGTPSRLSVGRGAGSGGIRQHPETPGIQKERPPTRPPLYRVPLVWGKLDPPRQSVSPA